MDVKEVLSSEPFTFIIGPARKKFFVNANLISVSSPVLEALMKGKFREANQKEAFLEDVEEDTFVRFVEYAWTGTYTPPPPLYLVESAGARENEEKMPALAVEQPPSIWEARSAASSLERSPTESPESPPVNPIHNLLMGPAAAKPCFSRNKLGTSQIARLAPFQDLVYREPHNRIRPPPTSKNFSDAQDFSGIFLCHAQLYVFGDKYNAEDLKGFSAHRLHQTLATFTLFPGRVCDIVVLVQYIFDHTLDSPDEPLRRMISNYCAWNIILFSKDKGFLEFYEAGGPFTRDVLICLTRRL
ncbi:hypothetical protein TWF694_004494 [Orbilia ellipsospora]|uniref:BTB domain-containing protein n=1 Tax=Orbilia ellipsospora TaxID=2528407 RepID=A0AAV9WV88_9PEZI